jgi:hypothetical protein
LILVVLLFLSGGLNFYLVLRKADLIVVDKTSGRTLLINDKDYGKTEAVQISPDNPTTATKRRSSRSFCAAFTKSAARLARRISTDC